MTQLDPKHAMVVLSGGQDSTTCLGWALDVFEKVSCVTFDYRQKHRRELDAAAEVVSYFESYYDGDLILHDIVQIQDIFLSSSPLTNPAEQLEMYKNHNEMEGIIGDRVEKTFVPMRNAVFLMIAANRAIAAEAGVLVTGVCEADNANYPDCRQIFIDSAAQTINMALGIDTFRIETPLMRLSKAETVKLAYKTPGTYKALRYSHTAYDGNYPPNGHDHASILRAHGFEQAGMPDPLVVRAWREGLMDLPQTSNYATTANGWELL